MVIGYLARKYSLDVTLHFWWFPKLIHYQWVQNFHHKDSQKNVSLFLKQGEKTHHGYLRNTFQWDTVVLYRHISSVQLSRSVMSDSLQPHESQQARPPCPSPSPGVYPKFMSIESVMPSNHLILCCPLLLLPSIFPSIRVFSNESALHIRWLKYWSFSFNISPSNEHPVLISFMMG